MRRTSVPLLVVLAVGLLAGSLAAQDAGSYTKAQADTGAKLFTESCAVCHGQKLEGGAGPALAGKDFLAKWGGQTADDVHYVVSTQMPLTAPGTLKADQSLALVAFILSKNGVPAGDALLTAAKLKTVKIKKP